MNRELVALPYGLLGMIYRSPMPFSVFDREADLLETYRLHHIQKIVMLVSDNEACHKSGRDLRALYQQLGYGVVQLPILDFSIPETAELRQVVTQVYQEASTGRSFVIHCHAGIGRTGLFLACLAKHTFQWEPNEAINWVRQYVPGAVEVPGQRWVVEDF